MRTEHPIEISIKAIEKRLDEITRQIKLDHLKDPELIILDNADIIKLFRISSGTAQNWRDEGILTYFQIKTKIYYRVSDIQKLINRSLIKKK